MTGAKVILIQKRGADPFTGSVLKGEFSGLRRIPIGDYRIAYEVQNRKLLILVVRVAHGREVYKDR
jgi:mRNA interferase RelE/StbE